MNIYCSALLLLSGLMPMMALTATASTLRALSLGPTTTQQVLPEPVDRADPGMCRADEEIVAS